MRKHLLLLITLGWSHILLCQTHFFGSGPVKTLLINDGKTAVTFTNKGIYLKFWDLTTGERVSKIKFDEILEVSLSPDHSQIALFNKDAQKRKAMVIVDVSTRKTTLWTKAITNNLLYASDNIRFYDLPHIRTDRDTFQPVNLISIRVPEGTNTKNYFYSIDLPKKEDAVTYRRYNDLSNTFNYIVKTKKAYTLYEKKCDTDESAIVLMTSPTEFKIKTISDDGNYIFFYDKGLLNRSTGSYTALEGFNLDSLNKFFVKIDIPTNQIMTRNLSDNHITIYELSSGKLKSQLQLDPIENNYSGLSTNLQVTMMSYSDPNHIAHVVNLETGDIIQDLLEDQLAAAEESSTYINDLIAQGEKKSNQNDAAKLKRPDDRYHEPLFEQSGLKVVKRINSYSTSGGGPKLAKVSVILLNDSGEEKSGKFLLAYSDGNKAEGQIIDFCLSDTAGKELVFMSKEVTSNIIKIEVKEFSMKKGCN